MSWKTVNTGSPRMLLLRALLMTRRISLKWFHSSNTTISHPYHVSRVWFMSKTRELYHHLNWRRMARP